MHLKSFFPALFFFAVNAVLFSQHDLPVIRANSNLVDIRDGEELMPEAWTIMPEYRPDVYTTSSKGEAVTFYTDLDSITFTVEAHGAYDFIILLNGKDTAYTRIQHQPSYLEVLQGAAAYDENDLAEIPAFTYQPASDPDLVALRETYQLDSIAGAGNEVSKILNLMRWVHELIPHDGNRENPGVKNAPSLITTCEEEGRGLNCRGLATVLNECYLAMGIPSRFVTCMPKDSVFNDCHVINMVYSTELQKWLWIDPTQNAYVMNERGELLSIEEVRERLISGRPLLLNPDANWNRRHSTEKAYYLYEYMAKNLYRFSCPAASRFDYETPAAGKTVTYVELLPLDGLQQEPKVTEETGSQTKMKFRTFKTNDPRRFWAKPATVR